MATSSHAASAQSSATGAAQTTSVRADRGWRLARVGGSAESSQTFVERTSAAGRAPTQDRSVSLGGAGATARRRGQAALGGTSVGRWTTTAAEPSTVGLVQTERLATHPLTSVSAHQRQSATPSTNVGQWMMAVAEPSGATRVQAERCATKLPTNASFLPACQTEHPAMLATSAG